MILIIAALRHGQRARIVATIGAMAVAWVAAKEATTTMLERIGVMVVVRAVEAEAAKSGTVAAAAARERASIGQVAQDQGRPRTPSEAMAGTSRQ